MNKLPPTLSVGELMLTGEARLQTGPFGTQLKASEYVSEGIPVINVRNVGFGEVRADDLEYISEAKAEQLHQHIIREGDIVFGRKGAVERHALIKKEEDGWAQGSDCLRLRLNSPRVGSQYLSYYLRTKAHQDWMQALCSFGATMNSLNQDIVSRIRFPLPSLDQQEKVVAILAAYDELIANNQRRIELLETMAEEIYREWFVRLRFPNASSTGRDHGVPTGWKVMPLRALVSDYIGGGWGEEQATTECTEGAYVLRGTDLPSAQKGDWRTFVHRYHKSSALRSRKLIAGDFVFETSGGSTNQLLGRNLMVSEQLLEELDDSAICASFCKLIRFDPSAVSPLWMKYYLKLYYDTGLVGLFQVQSTGISNYQFEAFLSRQTVVVPGAKVQEEFRQLVEPLNRERDNLARANIRLSSARNALLPRLISGKLRIDHLDIQMPHSMRAETAQAA